MNDLAWIDDLSPEARNALLLEAEQELSFNRLFSYRPYPKQREFHRAGADTAVRERLLKAGNQSGKTYSAACETAMHLTGAYPDDWEGAVFDTQTTGWGASITSQVTRDTVQRLLLGQPGQWGTGMIPKRSILDIKRAAHGVADAVESISVRHKTGGISRITLKSYDQGRERFQGETLDFVWFDEEPPMDIYLEGLTRTNATDGVVWLTFTPLLGMSDVVRRFLVEKTPGTHVTNMTIYDAGHYTDEQRAAIIASYPAHERDARAMGTPILGSGLVFTVPDEKIMVNPFEIPAHWPRICGLDFGWDHPFAAAGLAWDRDSDCVYVVNEYRESRALPAVHVQAIQAWGAWIPVAWPHDGLNTEKGSGDDLIKGYRDLGLNVLKDRATLPPSPGREEGTGGNSVEASVMMMLERMETGRFKVFSTCGMFFEEKRMYHRKHGKIVKINEDLIDAARMACMMLRHAQTYKPRTQGHTALTKSGLAYLTARPRRGLI